MRILNNLWTNASWVLILCSKSAGDKLEICLNSSTEIWSGTADFKATIREAKRSIFCFDSMLLNNPMKSKSAADDYEFILLHVQAAFDLDKFGVSIGEVRGKFEEQSVWEAWAEQDYKCAGCGNEITRGEIEADHILPVKGNGKTIKDNLQILCNDCNGDKSSGMTFNELEEVIKKKSGRLTAEQIKKIGQVLSI